MEDRGDPEPDFSPTGACVKVFPGTAASIEFINTATGATRSIAADKHHSTGFDTSTRSTSDLRFQVVWKVGTIVKHEPAFFDRIQAWLRIRPLPTPPADWQLPPIAWDQVNVLDMETGASVFDLSFARTTQPPLLSDDGRTLVTQHADFIAVWDVPAHPSWRWVLGIPLAIAGLILLGKRVRARWTARPQRLMAPVS